MNIDLRYPLVWPNGWPRTPGRDRKPARFRSYRSNLEIREASRRLDQEMRLIKADDGWLISSNAPLRGDGLPSQRAADPQDSGVAVYFKLRGAARVLACDRYRSLSDNVYAIALHIKALRAIDRYGVGSLDQAFAGYFALPANTAADWRAVFGFSLEQRVSKADIEDAYRQMVRSAHPDTGGSHDAMARLGEAKAFALKEVAS